MNTPYSWPAPIRIGNPKKLAKFQLMWNFPMSPISRGKPIPRTMAASTPGGTLRRKIQRLGAELLDEIVQLRYELVLPARQSARHLVRRMFGNFLGEMFKRRDRLLSLLIEL